MNFIKKYYVGILHFVLILLVSATIFMGVQLKNNAQPVVPTIIVPATKQEVHTTTRCPSTNQRKQIDTAINKYSKKYDVDPLLIRAIVKKESNFNPNAVSKTGDRGLMQINKCHKLKKPFDINTNVEFGTKMISGLIEQNNGNVRKALYCYNAGTTNVRRGRIPRSTRRYASAILSMRGKV